MAPRKAKTQGKRNNNVKIKSKVISQKRKLKPMKKVKQNEKPLDNLNWLNKISNDRMVKKCTGVPAWLNSGGFKHTMPRRSLDRNVSDYADYQPKNEEEKSTVSDASDECKCSHSKFSENKGGILKRKSSSTTSLVAKYIKSGMDHVASFIVESAIRFGEQHGVVIPDKNTPNVYEITPPDKFQEKCRRIRFRIPEKSNDYKDPKKTTWRNQGKEPRNESLRQGSSLADWKADCLNKTVSGESNTDSLDEILPLLEKLKDREGIIRSDLDLKKLKNDTEEKRSSENERERVKDRSRVRNKERERNAERDRDMERDVERDRNIERDRDLERERERDRERERERERGRVRERLREKFRLLGKRFKSVGAVSDKVSEENEYKPATTNPWKKFRRDSLELGRQRLRASTCPRKPECRSPSPY